MQNNNNVTVQNPAAAQSAALLDQLLRELPAHHRVAVQDLLAAPADAATRWKAEVLAGKDRLAQIEAVAQQVAEHAASAHAAANRAEAAASRAEDAANRAEAAASRAGQQMVQLPQPQAQVAPAPAWRYPTASEEKTAARGALGGAAGAGAAAALALGPVGLVGGAIVGALIGVMAD